ncbi:MAG: Uma2 family endonuclease [Gordonia sp. (in: high G+C Gram-positive bacteria)]
MSPAPTPRHQRASGRLFVALSAVCPPGVEALSAPLDVALTTDTVIQPDIVVAFTTDLTEHNLPTAPLLAVEALSPSTREIDLHLKKARLARAGCPHYWMVDPGRSTTGAVDRRVATGRRRVRHRGAGGGRRRVRRRRPAPRRTYAANPGRLTSLVD